MSGEVLLQARCAKDHEWDLYGTPVAGVPAGESWVVLRGGETAVRLTDLRCPACQPTTPAVEVHEAESLA